MIGFGLDRLIEVRSGAALLWRLHRDLNPSQLHPDPARSSERSIPGIMVVAVSVVVMP